AAALLAGLPLLALPSAGAGTPPAADRPASRAAAAPSQADLTFFETRVRPLLAARCAACHGAKVSQGGLRLDQPDLILRGGASGPVVTPGKPETSRLVEAVAYMNPALRMPPGGQLSTAEVEVLREWVRRGAPVPRGAGSAAGAPKRLMLEEGRRFWSLRP